MPDPDEEEEMETPDAADALPWECTCAQQLGPGAPHYPECTYILGPRAKRAEADRDALAGHLARALAYAKVHPHAPQKWLDEAERCLFTMKEASRDPAA